VQAASLPRDLRVRHSLYLSWKCVRKLHTLRRIDHSSVWKVPTNGEVRAVAIGVATFACLVHAVWRKGGIYLNNAFGFVKIAMLIMLFVVGIASAAGAFKGNQFEKPAEVVKENFGVHKAFSGASTDSYGYAEAFLAIIFAFGGFNQANYVSAFVLSTQKVTRAKIDRY
jgi:amino acid transporter